MAHEITARELGTRALRLSGAISGLQAPDSSEIELALEQLNDILVTWSLEDFWSSYTIHKDYTVPSKTNEILVSSTAELVDAFLTDQEVPDKILEVWKKSGDSWSKLKRETDINYNPNETTVSSYVYSRTSITKGLIRFNGELQENQVLKFVYNGFSVQYELDDLVTIPPAHRVALEWAVASLLSIHFGVDNPSIPQIAASKFEKIKMSQFKTPRLAIDYPSQSHYNIYTDSET